MPEAPAPSTALADASTAPPAENDEHSLIWAIRCLECAVVEKFLTEGVCPPAAAASSASLHGSPGSGAVFEPAPTRVGVTQRHLDCGLHEVATGERHSVVHQEARLQIATRLVECGADPDNRQHGCGGTPLHHTLAGGYVELVEFLLDARADVNAANRYGVHPLHIAVKREYTDCIACLMSHELPLDKVKEELGWAVQYDLGDAVRCLLSNGTAARAERARALRPRLSPLSAGCRHRRSARHARALPVDVRRAALRLLPRPLPAARLLPRPPRLAHPRPARRAVQGRETV